MLAQGEANQEPALGWAARGRGTVNESRGLPRRGDWPEASVSPTPMARAWEVGK